MKRVFSSNMNRNYKRTKTNIKKLYTIINRDFNTIAIPKEEYIKEQNARLSNSFVFDKFILKNIKYFFL